MKEFWVKTLQRTPKWILILVVAVLYALYSIGERLLTGERVGPGHVVGAVFAGVMVAAAGFLAVRWQSRRDSKKPPGSLTSTNFERALTSGNPPEDAEADEWVPKLHRAIRTDQIMAWAGPLLFGGFTVMGIFLTVTNPDYPWFWVLATGFFAATAIWYPIWVRRRRMKLQALIDHFSGGGEHVSEIRVTHPHP